MKHPVLLAIECSQRKGGVALQDRNGEVHALEFETGVRRDDVLMPSIDSLLSSCGLRPGDLEGCGVSIGPGGFTGLRISVSTARGLGMTIGLALYGIPSALVVAGSAEGSPAEVLVCLACKGGTAWLTRVHRDASGTCSISRAGELVADDAADQWLDGVTQLLGDEHVPGPLRNAAVSKGITVHEPAWEPDACLRQVVSRHAEGTADDPASLLPIYPRPPEAVSLWEARKGV